MTTWHENENIEDIVEYFRWNTVFDDFVPERFVVLFLGKDEEIELKIREKLAYFFRD